MLKRLSDILVSSFVLLLIWPVFIVVGLLIKLDSGGPVFFKQVRLGKDKVPFWMFKFRKFPVKYNSFGPGVTVAGDKRLSGIGRILERWKIDEVPQFLNVLKGDMSLVGPRPETPNFVEYYRDEYQAVFNIRPGIFGVNQLIYRNEAELYPPGEDPERFYVRELMPRKLRNDIEYLRQESFLLDLKIFVSCILTVINRSVINHSVIKVK